MSDHEETSNDTSTGAPGAPEQMLIAARKAALREAEAKVRALLSQARTRLKEE